jgi:hypothetical protein
MTLKGRPDGSSTQPPASATISAPAPQSQQPPKPI